jgi:hypothetical protein
MKYPSIRAELFRCSATSGRAGDDQAGLAVVQAIAPGLGYHAGNLRDIATSGIRISGVNERRPRHPLRDWCSKMSDSAPYVAT